MGKEEAGGGGASSTFAAEGEDHEADVETVARECELDADAAELRLREHGGDVESVLRAYIREEVRALIKMHPEDAENVELGLTEKDVFSPAKAPLPATAREDRVTKRRRDVTYVAIYAARLIPHASTSRLDDD